MKFSIRFKILGGFLIVIVLMAILGIFAIYEIATLADRLNFLNNNIIPSLNQLSTIEQSASRYRQLQYQHITAPTPDDKKIIEDESQSTLNTIEEAFQKYEPSIKDPKARKLFQDVHSQWTAYLDNSSEFLEVSRTWNYSRAAEILAAAKPEMDGFENALKKWGDYNLQVSSEYVLETQKIYSFSIQVIIGVLVLSILLALGLGLLIASGIANAARLMAQTAEQIASVDLTALSEASIALASGDLTRSITVKTQPLSYQSKDEMGRLAEGYNQMIFHLQETGHAFDQMVENLRTLIQQVTESAMALGTASVQLAEAATQTGEATGRIAQTSQQVAQGAARQTDNVSHTAISIEQLTHSIDGVARGAQEQASSVGNASKITADIFTAIQQVSIGARAQAESTTSMVDVSRKGADTVGQAVHSMEAIKTKVDLSVSKVQEMGERSQRIGIIAEMIRDIASQTDLLALNAAIEAARAGQHGAGFAVVADEVRKLSEKSTRSTQEVATLIKDIQKTVDEAIQAMRESAGEVETGVSLADEAGQALANILKKAEEGNRSGEEIAAAAERMGSLAGSLVTSMDSVSAVVEQNAAATEEMTASASTVSQMIDNIAAISKDNSIAVEQVSTATDEVNTQVDGISNSVHSLANMASTLQSLVKQFRLTNEETAILKIDDYIDGHNQWVRRLDDMLSGKITLRNNDIESHSHCALGRWYYNFGKAHYGHLQEYNAVDAPHRHLHRLAWDAVDKFNHGERSAAEMLIKQVKVLSREINSSLESLKTYEI